MLVALFLLPLAAARSLAHHHEAHDHSLKKRLPNKWYHEEHHPVHALFKRGDDTTQFPAVGSQAWSSMFPSPNFAPDSTQMPKEWRDALNAAVAAGAIPNIPQTNCTTDFKCPDGNPFYPAGVDPTSPEICSSTYKKCRIPGDIWDAPPSHFGTGFDDGPTPSTPKLLQFLAANNEKATHFMIGANILYYPDIFLKAYQSGDDIAVHTWSHPHMTLLSNEDVVAQLGWSMQLIYTSTGGRVPRFWRPPYGDSDNRVHAIAKAVFGLDCILWNQDTEDWSLASNGTTLQAINSSLTTWITGPKTPGLIILEHELTDDTVGAFMSAYPLLKQQGWTLGSVAQLVDGKPAYWNAAGATGTVSEASILQFGTNTVTPTSTVGQTTNTASPTSQSTTSLVTNGANAQSTGTGKPSAALRVGPSSVTWTIFLGLLLSLTL